MCTQPKKQIKIVLIIFIFIFGFYCVNKMIFLNNNIQIGSYYIKRHAKDYSSVDLLKIQKIILEIEPQTKETLNKYDVDEDGKITYTDLRIIQDMNIKIYDMYMVKKGKRYAIKFNND